MSNDKEFHIVLWGATGFTGSLCAEYLMVHAPPHVKWAMAGRSENKLATVKQEILTKIEQCNNEPVFIIADSSDASSIDAMVARTNVIMSCVGPFSLYGTPLVESCVRQGTDYCDITGETPWVKRMIKQFDHQAATVTKTCIVPCCGFDSIPADLGTLFVTLHAEHQMNDKCIRVKSHVIVEAGFSGGTAASLINSIENADPEDDMKEAFYLNPKAQQRKPTVFEKDQLFIKYSKDLKKWTAPFVMAQVNTRVVRRSAMLMPKRYGNNNNNFEYNECSYFRSFVPALGFTIFFLLSIFIMVVLIKLGQSRIVRKALPAPGTGPSEERRKKSYFKYTIVAETEQGKKIFASVSGGDPGYTETAKMLSESALCLALDREQLPIVTREDKSRKGGILTPATCMGELLIHRLQAAGLHFNIDKVI